MYPKPPIIILLLLLFPVVLSSQQVFSLSGGISIPKIIRISSNPHLSVDADFKNSFVISFDYNKYIGKHFGLGLQLDYINTATDLVITTGGLGGGYYTDSAAYRFGFINIVVLPGFKWGNKVQFFLQTGPYYGILVHASNDTRGHIQSPDVGLTGVFGLRVYITKQMGFVIKNTYNYSFINKYRNAGDLKIFNIMLLGGLYYSLSGEH